MMQQAHKILYGLSTPLWLASRDRSMSIRQAGPPSQPCQLLQRTVWGVLLFVFAIVPISGMDALRAEADPLTFTVRSAVPVYYLSETTGRLSPPIRLTLTLSLDPNVQTPVTVSTLAAGSISVAVATRNGIPIGAIVRPVRFEADPVLAQIKYLRTLASGDSAPIPLDILPILPTGLPGPLDNGPGSLLHVVQLESVGEHVALLYPLTEPGLYTLQFRYQYTGPDDGRPNVFRDTVLSNTVRFRLR
jgi:hypothetical protein